MARSLSILFPSIKFGTSGVRALVDDLHPQVVSAYVYAFIKRIQALESGLVPRSVLVAVDLRPSSPAIAGVVCATLEQMGCEPVYAGAVPTPALALACIKRGLAGIMVTGSHIPFDRNGIKFYRPDGEISKEDEQAMVDLQMPEQLAAPPLQRLPKEDTSVAEDYLDRYRRYFPPAPLAGLRIGLYQHSAVGRDLLAGIFSDFGAAVIKLGRSDTFVPVDTEAVSEADTRQARTWCQSHSLDALVSTDGDGDRPLVFDESGEFVRGDMLGLFAARELGASALAVPVSCNTAIELSGAFEQVLRTRIGSPYVIAGMEQLVDDGFSAVAGFEANGGFLLGAPLGGLDPLPTRDALLPVLLLLSRVAQAGASVSGLIGALPARFTYSDRLPNIAPERSRQLLSELVESADVIALIFPDKGKPVNIDMTDGVRVTFEDGDVAHLRPSGNAPELRCYAESDSVDGARSLCLATLERVQ